MLLSTARSLLASSRYALPFTRAIQTSAAAWKASEPLPSESDIDPETDGFQTKIWEVLQMKPEDSHKLWICKDDTVFKAIQKMNKAGVGSLLVYDRSKGEDDGDHPHDISGCMGILTERDYMNKVVVKGKQSKDTAVADIMTPKDQLHVMTPHNTVLEAMHVMVNKNIRHVPVMDSHCMVGVLSMRDVMRTLLEDQKHEIEYLKDYIGGNSY